MREPPWHQQGQEPDYRFSLANERTFLAWMRTALALVAAAVLFHQFAVRIEPRWVVTTMSCAVAAIAAMLAAAGYTHWRSNQLAMRHSHPLPRSPLIAGLSLAMVLLCCAAAAVLLLQ